MNKFFAARSPIWQLLLALEFVGFGIITQVLPTDKENVSYGIPLLALSAIVLLTAFVGWLRLRAYNKKNGTRLTITQVYPSEFIEGDERQQSATNEATRKVYMYHNLALPVFTALIILFNLNTLYILVALGVLITGHYLTYMRGIWSVIGE